MFFLCRQLTFAALATFNTTAAYAWQSIEAEQVSNLSSGHGEPGVVSQSFLRSTLP
jgi:hypothetical protein